MRLDAFLCTAALAATLLVQPAAADDITGAQKILCAAVEATECYAEGACTPGAPEDWNMPRFVEIDLEGTGAAIGAGVGALGGRRARRQKQAQANQQIDQQSAQSQQYSQTQIENFKKAFSVCLEAKDYMVKF